MVHGHVAAKRSVYRKKVSLLQPYDAAKADEDRLSAKLDLLKAQLTDEIGNIKTSVQAGPEDKGSCRGRARPATRAGFSSTRRAGTPASRMAPQRIGTGKQRTSRMKT